MLALECQGSITKAAEQFFISPSAMSQCLKTEEKQLNCHLFERKNGKMIPTQEGKNLLKKRTENCGNTGTYIAGTSYFNTKQPVTFVLWYHQCYSRKYQRKSNLF